MPYDDENDPEHGVCVWTGERIEATKTVLFHEELFSTTDQRLQRAINILSLVHQDFSRKRSTQATRLSLAIGELQDILGIITDPECEGPLFTK